MGKCRAARCEDAASAKVLALVDLERKLSDRNAGSDNVERPDERGLVACKATTLLLDALPVQLVES